MEAVTRKEVFLAAAAGESIDLPRPVTREEQFLKKIAENAGSGSGANATKLSDLENDLFYHKENAVLTLTQADFTNSVYAADRQYDWAESIGNVILTYDGKSYAPDSIEGMGGIYMATFGGDGVLWSNILDVVSLIAGESKEINVFNAYVPSAPAAEYTVEFVEAETKYIASDVIQSKEVQKVFEVDINGCEVTKLHTVFTDELVGEIHRKWEQGYKIRLVNPKKIGSFIKPYALDVLCCTFSDGNCGIGMWFVYNSELWSVHATNGIYTHIDCKVTQNHLYLTSFDEHDTLMGIRVTKDGTISTIATQATYE